MWKPSIIESTGRFSRTHHCPRPTYARYEILNGDICLLPAPGTRHQAAVLRLAAALLRFVEARKLGFVLPAPFEVILSEKIVIQPDILFVRKERIGLIGEMNLRGAPDLIIEVLSRRSGDDNLKVKRKICADFQIPEYWAVDLDTHRVEILIWSELGYVSVGNYRKSDTLSSPLLPTLNLPLSRVFGAEND